jgi:hypothetical protein
MKKILLHSFFIIIFGLESNAQSITYSEHIAPIVYTHCTPCHRQGEIAPFSLTNYQEVKNWGSMIKYVTEIKYMPPWKADPNYQRYQKENYLNQTQIEQIAQWVTDGMPQGNTSLEPPLPVFPTGSQVGTPDLVLSFAKSHTVQGNNRDEYRYFVLPTGLTQDKDLIALEVRPGNKKLLHHALVWTDTTGAAALADAATPEYGYTNGGGTGLENQLPGYVPGMKVQLLTNGIAQRLPKNSDLKIQVHYAPSSTVESDSTSINLFFAQQPATRYLYSHILLPEPNVLTNGPFIIAPNTVKEFHGQFKVPIDVSVYSVSPHMHLLGTHWKVFAVKPNGDTVNLVRINEWDFNWQSSFAFKQLIPLPRNTMIHAFAGYDNTTNNPFNPNNPPQQVSWGEGTGDEMYYLPIHYLIYKPGDENVVFETTTSIGDDEIFSVSNNLYPVAPNPSSDIIKIGYTLAETSNISLEIFAIDGRKVSNVLERKLHYEGLHTIDLNTSQLAQGSYLLVMDVNGKKQSQKFIVAK